MFNKTMVLVSVLVLASQFLTMANALSSFVCELQPPVSPGDPPAIPDSPFIENLKVKPQFNLQVCVLVSEAFDSRPGSNSWNSKVDFNLDDIVDIYDAIIAANNP